ncbi:MAG: hypothetical protein CL983_04590 [Euryarchaeota archaeon]|nr:hypothetical protein [Euryarchaeota archaeon]|tara:strand:- start:14123 stop:14758 length:636 start_codon:yes stop_codon:yes gene_type:complete
MATTQLYVDGMTCDGCSSKLTKNFLNESGITSAEVSHVSRIAKIEHSEEITNLKLEEIVTLSGYSIGNSSFDWSDKSVWNQSARNTMWCLIGCSIGDFGTIAFFQFIWTDSGWSTMAIMMLAIMNGLLTSIALETVILLKQLPFKDSLRTAMGMSFISMVAMEAAMNITDVVLTGGAMLTPEVIIPMLIAGFVTPWPYNYWRLKKYGVSCH